MTANVLPNRPPLVVDAHLHVWSLDTARYPFAPNASYVPEIPGDAEMLLGLMAQSGVDRAVIVQPACYGYDHRYVTETLRAHPGRFAAACLVDPLAPDAPEQLAARHAEGYRGLRLNPSVAGEATWLNDPLTAPLWEQAAALGIVISLLILPHQMTRASEMIARFPEVPVIIDHLGRPEVALGEPEGVYADTLALAQYPNVLMKVSGIPHASQEPYPHRDVWPYVQLALSWFGPERCMWATDFPWITQQCGYDACLRLITDAMDFLSDADRCALLGETATRLWDFSA